MEQEDMTALVCAFARDYHARHNKVKVFDDVLADKILADEEKQQIAQSMISGINFFDPAFNGMGEEALRWIVDNLLSPSPLGRAVWAEKALEAAVKSGATQYLIFAAGYDTFAYRQIDWAGKLQIFELDQPAVQQDKRNRLKRICNKTVDNVSYIPVDFTAGPLADTLSRCQAFDKNKLSFCSLLGISYYLSKAAFKQLIQSISQSVPYGSTIAFDYPDEYTYTQQAGDRAKKHALMLMAAGTKEAMLPSYSYDEMSRLLSGCGFLVYEHLTPGEITAQYFYDYNNANPQHIITAFDNVNYCLASKKAGVYPQ